MKIGIFFGGQSREREVSFAGGRTVYDNLDKTLFEPVPIFVDSLGNFILLDWQHVYKGTIRDFYPPASEINRLRNSNTGKYQIYIESLGQLPENELNQIISKVGRRIYPHEFSQLIDFAFLTLHGIFGEDGNIQGILEWYNIPYSGSGILPSAIGIDKAVQSKLLETYGFKRPKQFSINRQEWLMMDTENRQNFLKKNIKEKTGFPVVIKSPHQGSSIGISIIKEEATSEALEEAIDKSFFIQRLTPSDFRNLSEIGKEKFLHQFTDIREGLGFPVMVQDTLPKDETLIGQVFYHPQELKDLLENTSIVNLELASLNAEESVLLESFIEGKEFSCIVIEQEKNILAAKEEKAIALPPTEIRKYQTLFDYRSKYLPGMSRKITPIETEVSKIEEIREECNRLFHSLNCDVYARIDGFLDKDGNIFLNDPNTTSGMLPSSFFFHQAAEIGLNPSQFLTYIIRTSLVARLKTAKNNLMLKKQIIELDFGINALQQEEAEKIRVAVIMGGYSTERHISMESGRNIYEKLASSTKYKPFPVFLTGAENAHELYRIPVNIMLKDNADDTKEKIKNFETGVRKIGSEVIQQIILETENIRMKYAGSPSMKPSKLTYEELVDQASIVFIALHGRPGEDGAIQKELEKVDLPYNGSGIESSEITINKYQTNEILKQHGILIAAHQLIYQHEWEKDLPGLLKNIETNYSYPLICKPADDGCSSAVKKIDNQEELVAFGNMMFRAEEAFPEKESAVLKLKPNEEFPQKNYFLLEELIESKGAKRFLEITGGLLTAIEAENESLRYEIFQPSETPALGGILSLEEKFLAGEGQNITPAIFSKDEEENKILMQQVQAELGKVAKVMNIEGYARIDAFVRVYEDQRIELIVVEINSLPGMTPATVIFHQAALNRYTPYQFIDKILSFGMEKNKLIQKAGE